MSDLFETAIVQKRNILNELRAKDLSLLELRFFSIYLSKINPRNIETRVVRFPLSDYQKIMKLGRINIPHLKASTDSLLGKKVHIPLESGGFTTIVLFDRCTVDKDKDENWFVEISANSSALPFMFDFKDRYFKYELWNTLYLKSSIQIRMYEILKQYEKIGKREIDISELRELLGIEPDKYSRLERFKAKVLDHCQKALEENTDICYTYERGKTGRSGKWLSIIFYIYKNKNCTRNMQLDDIGDVNDNIDIELGYDSQEEIDYGSELANLLGSAALNDEFNIDQVRVLQDLTKKAVKGSDHLEMCNYLVEKVHKMNVYNPKKENRFKYLCKIIESDIKEAE